MKNRTRRLSAVAAFTLVLSASPEAQNITSAQLAAPLGAEPTRWLHYNGDYSGQRHSPLTQVTPGNVNQLSVQWAFQTGVLGKFETTPLVIDGILVPHRSRRTTRGRSTREPAGRSGAISARTARRTATSAAVG